MKGNEEVGVVDVVEVEGLGVSSKVDCPIPIHNYLYNNNPAARGGQPLTVCFYCGGKAPEPPSEGSKERITFVCA